VFSSVSRTGAVAVLILGPLMGAGTALPVAAAKESPAATLATPAAPDSAARPAGQVPGHSMSFAVPAPRDTMTPPPIDSLVARALAGSPGLRVLEARRQGLHAAAKATGGLRSVMIGVDAQLIDFPDEWTLGAEEMSMIGPEVQIGIPFPGVAGAGRRAASGMADATGAELEVARRAVARDVRQTYAAIYAIDRELQAHRTVREMLVTLVDVARSRVASGAATMPAFEAALAVARLDETCDDLEIERADQEERLRRLLGDPSFPGMPTLRALPEVTAPDSGWAARAVASSSEVASARAGVRAADLEAAAARAQLRPRFLVGAGWGFRGQKDERHPDHPDVARFRLGVELPFLAGLDEKPMVHRAEGEARAARAVEATVESDVAALARRLERSWSLNEIQYRRYVDLISPLARSAFESARAELLTAGGAFADVLRTLTMWIDAEAGRAKREAARYSLWAAHESLTRPAPEGGSR
jgi:outer membrane protein TolC